MVILYWVNNRNDSAQQCRSNLPHNGKVPQIWHPETGKTEDASYTIANGMTKVILPLTPNDAVFVVFQKSCNKNIRYTSCQQQKKN